MSTAKSSPSVSYAKFSPFHRPRIEFTWCLTSVRCTGTTGRVENRRDGRACYHAWFFSHAQSSPHWIRVQRQDHSLSAHDQRPGLARSAHGKGEAVVGISKVPDARLDRLTAMYNPKKRVPATVEFTRPRGSGPDRRRPGARGRRGVQERRRARARRPRVSGSVGAHPSGSINPARDAQAMEDELILADLGVAERRLERIEQGPEEERGPPSSNANATSSRSVKAALEDGRPLRSLNLRATILKRLRGFQFLSAKPLLIVINLDEAQLAGTARRRRASAARPRPPGSDAVSLARRHGAPSPSARRSSSRSPSSRRPTLRRFSPISASQRVRPRSRDSRQLRSARLYFVLHGRRGRVPRLVDPARNAGAAGGGRDPQRHRARLHPRRGRQLRRADRRAARWPRAAITAKSGSRARSTSCRTATSSTSASRHEDRAPTRAVARRTPVTLPALVIVPTFNERANLPVLARAADVFRRAASWSLTIAHPTAPGRSPTSWPTSTQGASRSCTAPGGRGLGRSYLDGIKRRRRTGGRHLSDGRRSLARSRVSARSSRRPRAPTS